MQFVPNENIDGEEAKGLFRDGKLLVLSLNQSPQFPRRCVVTNAPVEELQSLTIQVHSTFLAILQIIFAPLLFAIAESRRDLPIKLQFRIGQSEAVSRRKAAYRRCGWFFLSLAFLIVLAICGLAFSEGGSLVVSIAFATMAALMFIGFWCLFLAAPPLYVRKRNKNILWLKGASPLFLAELPEWTLGKKVERTPTKTPDFTGLSDIDTSEPSESEP